MTKLMITLLVACILLTNALSQSDTRARLIDEFSVRGNDDLQARIDNFWSQVRSGKYKGVVVLSGSTLEKHINMRRVEGCNIIRQHPQNTLTYVFSNDNEYFFQLWIVPEANVESRFQSRPLSYKLDHLTKPVELSVSGALDEFCPRHFDVKWFSQFMTANPTFRCKVVIDTSNKDFLKRLAAYKKELSLLGVEPKRVRFNRRDFPHETDEQWWLIPPKK